MSALHRKPIILLILQDCWDNLEDKLIPKLDIKFGIHEGDNFLKLSKLSELHSSKEIDIVHEKNKFFL